MLTRLIDLYRKNFLWQTLSPVLALLMLFSVVGTYAIHALTQRQMPTSDDTVTLALCALLATLLVAAGSLWAFLIRRLMLQPQQQILTVLDERKKGKKTFSVLSETSAFGTLSASLNQVLRMNDDVDRQKREFATLVRQDFRAPMAAIRESLNVILDAEYMSMPEKVTRLLALTEKNSAQLSALIGDIADMQAFTSGDAEITLHTLDLAELAYQAIDAHQHHADAYGVRLLIAEAPSQATVRGDGQRLIEVFAHLLSNALRFSPRGTTVEIGIVVRNEWVRVSVRDRGPGIPEALRRRLFQRFLQVDASGSHHKDSAGLGLGISQAIIESHGGSIGYENRIGGGCEFHFELKRYRGKLL